MTPEGPLTGTMLDEATHALVRLAAVVAAGSEGDVRAAMQARPASLPELWVEELLLQTHLFAGFPRALNAMREWRRYVPEPVAPVAGPANRRVAGEETCERVYGPMYQRLRHNIEQLHPALDAWMIEEGYGKVLSRPGLDLGRRELCIVAACVASGQERQLHSHLHGSLNVGVPAPLVDAALDALAGVVQQDRLDAARLLWARVRGK